MNLTYSDAPPLRKFFLLYIAPFLLFLLLAGATLYLRSNPEREIRKRLDALAEETSKPPPEGVVGIARSAQALLDFFTPEARIDAGSPFEVLENRREFVNTYVALRHHIKNMNIDLQNPVIVLGPDRRTASASLTAIATGRYHGERLKEVREFELALVKDDGRWRLHRVTLIDAITAPTL